MLAMHLDVSSEGEWAAVVAEASDRFDRLDVLVNNAGILTMAGVEDTTIDQWNRIIAVNQTGVWLGMKHCIPLMRRSGGGSIVNISSVYGMIGSGGATDVPGDQGCDARAHEDGSDSVRDGGGEGESSDPPRRHRHRHARGRAPRRSMPVLIAATPLGRRRPTGGGGLRGPVPRVRRVVIRDRLRAGDRSAATPRSSSQGTRVGDHPCVTTAARPYTGPARLTHECGLAPFTGVNPTVPDAGRRVVGVNCGWSLVAGPRCASSVTHRGPGRRRSSAARMVLAEGDPRPGQRRAAASWRLRRRRSRCRASSRSSTCSRVWVGCRLGVSIVGGRVASTAWNESSPRARRRSLGPWRRSVSWAMTVSCGRVRPPDVTRDPRSSPAAFQLGRGRRNRACLFDRLGVIRPVGG